MKDNQLFKNIKNFLQDNKVIVTIIISILAIFFIYNMGLVAGKFLYYLNH